MATEKEIERGCINLYQQLGCQVLKFSQPFKAAQTRGIPDLKVYNAQHRKTWWHEVKTPKGKMSEHQEKVRQMVTSCDEQHYVGGIDAAKQAIEDNLGVKFGL